MLRTPRPSSASTDGAAAGAVLRGCAGNNEGLRIRVLEDQPRGASGPVRGPFIILDAGDNRHTASLEALLHRPTDAAEVLRAIRRARQACVSVVNLAGLVADERVTNPALASPMALPIEPA
jgi:hypothetical protein